MKPIKKIVVGTDFSEATDAVLQMAIANALSHQASIELVHVREPFSYAVTGGDLPTDAQKEIVFNWIDDSLGRLAARVTNAGVSCITTTLDGSAHAQLVSHADKVDADLIVVGTHGRSGIAHAILGSVAERVVQKAHRPVLVVPTQRAGA